MSFARISVLITEIKNIVDLETADSGSDSKKPLEGKAAAAVLTQMFGKKDEAANGNVR